MTCTGAYATKEQYSEWWGYWQHTIDLTAMTPEQLTALDNQLALAAGQIHMAIQAVGACECSLSAASVTFLEQLNVISTAVVYRVPCGPRLDDEERRMWLEQLDKWLTQIRDGSIELCAGYTGKEFPAIGIAQHNWNEFSTADLIRKGIQRRDP